MQTLRLSISIVLMLMAVAIVAVNWSCFIKTERNKRKGINKHHSTVPLLSVILAGLGFSTYPFSRGAWIGIIPAVDIGNWLALVGFPLAIARGSLKKKQN